ncbi:MAG: TonB family protein [Synergistaceae bacterium]|nr:TonB family protein [Synergistaceae bacterium]
MTAVCGIKKKWLYAAAGSILLHGLLFVCLPAFERATQREDKIVVRLVERREFKAAQSPAVKKHSVPQKKKDTARQPEKLVPKQEQPVQTADYTPAETEASPVSDSGSYGGSSVSAAENSAASYGNENGGQSGILDVDALVITKKVLPVYPSFSRKRREEGTVVLLIKIVNDAVMECEVEKSSGYPRLDEAAKRAVSGWKFSNSASVRARVPVSFKLVD